MKHISYSQYSTYTQCPQKYKLTYIDKLGKWEPNIHLLFGTSIHETLQHYLDVMYNETQTKADAIDLNEHLFNRLEQNFIYEHRNVKEEGKFFCTKDELMEFYQDGCLFLDWFKKRANKTKFYSKKGYQLLGIELPIDLPVRTNLKVKGFIDVVIKDLDTNRVTIIDIKTSTKGWNDFSKKDKSKTDQILLYKMWFSTQYDVPIDMIDVEFHIMRRKVPEVQLEYTIPRMSKFVPSNGTVSLKKAFTSFNSFIDEVFTEEGTYNTNRTYEKRPSKLCEWCDFYKVHCDGKV